ncbi:LOW QUALITY PROTEIN: hypothetical protein MAR_018639 [Mya arenaria]|uniref:Uncharacterized protein n=1 Tax=Mya arenaria TaxID=6604 RepID=A0ABY7ENB2_MYAAR|nr:LOW QUALITY PROTEIN: hypothetical protein MAR_018639 [Mya arenaria]
MIVDHYLILHMIGRDTLKMVGVLNIAKLSKRKHEDMSDSEQDDSVEDNEAYVQLWKKARKTNDNKYQKIYNTFIEHGEESDVAQELAEERIKPYNEKDNYILPLKNSRLHTQIMAQIDTLISKIHSTTSALTKALRKHKNSFQDLFDMEFTELKIVKRRNLMEFKARKVQELMKKEEIHYFPTQNETKASTSERAILTRRPDSCATYRTRTRAAFYRFYKRSLTIITTRINYRNETHRCHGHKSERSGISHIFCAKLGYYVRISHQKTVFTRAYHQTYSGEVFKVHKRYHRGTLPIYRLQDLQDEDIKGTFYQSELQKISIDPEQKGTVEKVS